MPVYPPAFIERFWSRVDKTPGLGPNGRCWLWTGSVRSDGYGQIASPFRKRWPLRAHVVAWQLEHGDILQGQHVLHECDNPPCVRELFLGSHGDNMRDAVRKGRFARVGLNLLHPKGAEHYEAKWSWEQARFIRELGRSGHGYTEIARITNIPPRTVRRILSNESYVEG